MEGKVSDKVHTATRRETRYGVYKLVRPVMMTCRSPRQFTTRWYTGYVQLLRTWMTVWFPVAVSCPVAMSCPLSGSSAMVCPTPTNPPVMKGIGTSDTIWGGAPKARRESLGKVRAKARSHKTADLAGERADAHQIGLYAKNNVHTSMTTQVVGKRNTEEKG